MSEPTDLEALAALAAWYERYSQYRRKMPRLAALFAELDRLGCGRVLVQRGQWAIYALTDPDDGQVRYIGLTAHPEERVVGHRQEEASSPRKSAWVAALRARGLFPAMKILEVVDGEALARQREMAWIEACQRAGIGLLNETTRPARKVVG